MASTETTPRYRNFSSNMPLSTTITPRAPSTSITIEKEPERDPEEDCFMCRQAHVYVKPIGMHQERRVARRHPPPLTRAEIDELSRKKHLTKQEARKLLQCYFPEIKNVKSFQLHKYHSCCYDPKHLNLCKNHITALQHEREQHPYHHYHHHNGDGNNESHYKDYEREHGQHNRVSFVRIKIEPTKGIPTRFLGPTALPESLADMLIKQVNRFEDKKVPPTFNSNYTTLPYNIKRVDNQYDSDDDNDEDEDDEDYTDDDGNNKQQGQTKNGDLVVEDLDQLKRVRINDRGTTNFSQPLKRKTRKKGTKKKTDQKSKLKHWEVKALEQSLQESCNCRHQVLHLENGQVVADWCRCKDHQHKDIIERHQSIEPPPSPRPAPKQPAPLPPPSPPPPPSLPPRSKQRKVRKRSIGIDATEPETTELALAYDPSAVDYDMVQEVIYYRTSSGRLIKPEITNAFSYDTMPQAINTMVIDPLEPVPNKAEVLYMTPSGQIQPYENGGRRGKLNIHGAPVKSVMLTNPGTVYNGHAYIDPQHSTSKNNGSTMPVLKLPPTITSPKQHSGGNNYQPAEFTLATFSSDKSVGTPASQRSIASGSQHSITSSSQVRARTVPKPLQKSSKPTYSNLEPTPDYGRESSIVANRRWFDQPLGDQNLRPVHDGQYGLIAGTSTGSFHSKSQSAAKNSSGPTTTTKNDAKCTIS